ncbi:PAS domain S-box protein [Variovorax sp. NFACC27]|uniref:PAS domain S-box protein n=1 Tax=unclassified Variovorax TaxID=663243 RepID=UPI0008987E6A|nr:PAS domain S-box protein [Variovorax sp. YR750]SEF20967.1 His Kinase A (phospho-acceptor) domain-containing protein [Variovorax sp. NFACC28]SEF50753.1 His Kinase A (phospho-acceptor) domain-containing protein [Variovorax sp. NFACC29]SFB68145.1 His Kinase A (phospho-acceptor) domain-containing protein [Variovorax sp. NFACC26]SFG49704.1 His Kinase A (phospho-acceptor) domain-containing protein [Variovorax sp. NFACC27]SEK85136.1 PAS domain S-box-containing protein [Variovorax sp. YR750]
MADNADRPSLPPGAPMQGPSPGFEGFDEGSVFRSLFVAYPDSLLVVDRSGSIMLANPSAAALLGYAADELVGLNVDVLVPDSIRPRHASYREAYGHAPRPRPMGTHMELVAKRKDGSEVMVEIALSPLQSHGLPFVVAAIRDIGAYPRVKQALQRARYSEHLAQLGRLAVDTRDLQVVLEHVPAIITTALQVEVAMVWLLDSTRPEFRVASGVGLVAGEEIGARIANRPDTPPGFVFSQGRPVVVQDYAQESRFSVPPAYLEAGLVSALAVPLSDRGRVIGMLSVRSKESRRFGDEEVRFLDSLSSLIATSLQRMQTEEALNHSQRLESVGQLTGGIAHDFNNLLTVIQGNLQVLEELPVLAQDGYAQQLLAAAARATRRGAELTGKLLAFSRRQMLQPSAVDTRALLHSLADMLRRTLDQRIRIEIDTAPGCPPVVADPGQLESALLNIAINARDAMPEGGTLRFRTEPCGALPTALRGQRNEPQGDTSTRFVAISIADSGTGMSEAVKERAFEPFFTTKEAGRGTGLGLSTVYGFVNQSRGAVAIDSKAGQGTTVTLYLPQQEEARPTAAAEEPTDETVPAGLRVMLVEDDAEVRKVVHTFLSTLGCEVFTAATAEQALSALDAGTGPFDLLLSDIALGAGMRGTRLAYEVQQRLPRLAVLLMSGFSSELLDADREVPQSWELLRKPYTRSELARAMARVLASRA